MFVVNDFVRARAPRQRDEGKTGMKRLRSAGDRAVKTTVEQTLMRGLVTAFPCVRLRLPRSASGRR
jgi:hypothetical protein